MVVREGEGETVTANETKRGIPKEGSPRRGVLSKPIDLSCPQCGKHGVLVDGREVYGNNQKREDLAGQWYWRCPDGHAHVGCFRGTQEPLGTLATKRMRVARTEAHAEFDRLWKKGRAKASGMMRRDAYRWLAKRLGIRFDDCHMALFDVKMCSRVVEVCRNPNARENG